MASPNLVPMETFYLKSSVVFMKKKSHASGETSQTDHKRELTLNLSLAPHFHNLLSKEDRGMAQPVEAFTVKPDSLTS